MTTTTTEGPAVIATGKRGARYTSVQPAGIEGLSIVTNTHGAVYVVATDSITR